VCRGDEADGAAGKSCSGVLQRLVVADVEKTGEDVGRSGIGVGREEADATGAGFGEAAGAADDVVEADGLGDGGGVDGAAVRAKEDGAVGVVARTVVEAQRSTVDE